MLLTIGMMVKNEEKHLEECLEALTPIREALDSELVIVDTGSDDNTVELAKQFTDKVYFHDWNDNFSEMRNTVISYAKGDWYFSLDGDEVINNPEGFIDFFKSGKYKKFNTALVTQKNYTDVKNDKFSLLLVPRIFKNTNDFHFDGAIHNQPQFKKPLYQLDTILDHYGYISSDKKLMEKKFNRTAKILKQELEKDPDNIYYWFQLSKSYMMHQDKEEALEAIEKAYNLANKNKINLKKRMYIYIQLAYMKMVFKKPIETKKICTEALKIKDGYIDLYYYLAWAQRNLGLDKKAIKSYEKYLDIYKNYDNSVCKIDTAVSDSTLSNIEFVYTNLIILYNKQKESKKVIKYSDEISQINHLKKVKNIIVKAYYNNNQLNDLINYYLNLEEDKQFIIALGFETLINNEKQEEKIKIVDNIKELEDNYGLLNKIRSQINKKKYNENFKHELSELKYEEIPNFYGDIFYFIFKQKDLYYYNILKNIREEDLNRFIQYLNKKYDDLSESIIEFIDYEIEGVAEARVNKSLSRYLLALDNDIDMDQDSKEIIDNYLSAGLHYIEKIYTEAVIENELIYELKSKEEAFLLYMYKAFAVKDSDLKTYIKYLRQAIDVYPLMKKVVETLLLEIKEEQDKVNQELEVEKDKFKANIEELINQGKLNEAENLIEEYQNNFEPDDEIYSMLGIIAINKGQNKKAKNLFKKGLEIEQKNSDLLYNLAFIYESEENYLAALENYEKSIFNMEDSPGRKELIKYINEFENKYKCIIQKQLEEREETGINYIENPKYRFVHLMYDNFYCNKFMHFTNEHFDEEDHLYLMVVPENHEFKHIVFEGLDNVKVINLKNDINKLNYYLNNTNKIFIHYLFDHICRILTKLDIKKEFYWVLYGGDLYNYINKEIHSEKTKEFMKDIGFKFNNDDISIDMIYRKSFIRKLNYVLTSKTGDFNIFNKTFLMKAKRYDFRHPSVLDLKNLDKETNLLSKKYQFKNKYEKVLLIGNSANSSNNHIDILYELKRYNLKKTCIIMPLSYSGHERYINQLIKKGKEMFGDRFIPIKEYLDKEVYSQILKQVDVAIFNHKRQQALGNISVLLYFGKKVYLRSDITSFIYLEKNGLKVFEINNLKSDILNDRLYKISNKTVQNNKNNLIKLYNNKTRIDYMNKIFNKSNYF